MEIRTSDFRTPRTTPYLRMARRAYAEHVGWNRQAGPKNGEIPIRYRSIKKMGMVRSLKAVLLIKKDRTKLISDFPVIERRRPLFGSDEDVDPLWEAAPVQPEEFPHETFDSISQYGVSGSLACRDPQSARVQPAGIHLYEKMLCVKPFAEAI